MSNRQTVMFSHAKDQAVLSTDPLFRVGAVVSRGKNILGRGRNLGRKSHPIHAKMHPNRSWKGLHAEIAALRGLRPYDVQGSDLYVCRILVNGSFAMAKPCEQCQAFLKDFGLRKIWYTTDEGVEEL